MAKNKSAVEPEMVQAPKMKRPPLTVKEKFKLYIAVLLIVAAFVSGYFVIKSLTIAYDSELGGIWQLKSVALEGNTETDAQVGLRLATDDEKNGPEATYTVLQPGEEIMTDTGKRSLDELGDNVVTLTVSGLTPWEATAEQLKTGVLDIQSEKGHEGILKQMETFFLDNGDIVFCYGFSAPVDVTNMEVTNRHIQVHFEKKAE